FLRYNTWANGRVVDLCRSLDADLLRDDAGGTLGSVEGTLIHLVTVEESYLAMLQGRDLAAAFGSREEDRAHDLAWFLDRAACWADGYASLLDARDAAWLAQPLTVPWFGELPLTMRDGLLQVFTHSTQHRAQVLSVLGARGITVPEMDYVFMLREQQRA